MGELNENKSMEAVALITEEHLKKVIKEELDRNLDITKQARIDIEDDKIAEEKFQINYTSEKVRKMALESSRKKYKNELNNMSKEKLEDNITEGLMEAWKSELNKKQIESVLDNVLKDVLKEDKYEDFKDVLNKVIENAKGVSDWVKNYEEMSKQKESKITLTKLEALLETFIKEEIDDRNDPKIMRKGIEISNLIENEKKEKEKEKKIEKEKEKKIEKEKEEEEPKDSKKKSKNSKKKSKDNNEKDDKENSKDNKENIIEPEIEVELAFDKNYIDNGKDIAIRQKVQELKKMAELAREVKKKIHNIFPGDIKNITIRISCEEKNLFFVKLEDQDTKNVVYLANREYGHVKDWELVREYQFNEYRGIDLYNLDPDIWVSRYNNEVVDRFDSNLIDRRIAEYRQTSRAIKEVDEEIIAGEKLVKVNPEAENFVKNDNIKFENLKSDILKDGTFNHNAASRIIEEAIDILDTYILGEENKKTDISVLANTSKYHILRPERKLRAIKYDIDLLKRYIHVNNDKDAYVNKNKDTNRELMIKKLNLKKIVRNVDKGGKKIIESIKINNNKKIDLSESSFVKKMLSVSSNSKQKQHDNNEENVPKIERSVLIKD